MKNLSINLFTRTRNEAFGIVSQINNHAHNHPAASALDNHITGADCLTATTIVVTLDDCTKTEAAHALLNLMRVYAPFGISGCLRAYYKNINKETTILSLPVKDLTETEDNLKKHKIDIPIEDLSITNQNTQS